jgi:Holliday junction resolvasome RuvABC ATP-dependent DNA helicase subunit
MSRVMPRRFIGDQDSKPVARPNVLGFDELIGQAQAIRQLCEFGQLYASKNQVADHILLVGAEGMGKRTLARAFAERYSASSEFVETDFKKIERRSDLTAILTAVEPGESLCAAGLHALRKPDIQEILEDCLTHFACDLLIGKGPRARVHRMNLQHFCCLATAPRLSDCAPELLRCFGLHVQLTGYSTSELTQIAIRIAGAHGLSLSEEVAGQVVSVGLESPGEIASLVKRLARLKAGELTAEETPRLLEVLGLAVQSFSGSTASGDCDFLSGTDFEKLVSNLLTRMGFRAELTKASGDGGVDVVATLRKPLIGGRYLIQCKRFAGDSLVGSAIVREFYRALVADQKAVKGILITTSGFTAQAQEFARNLPIELVDGVQLRILLAEYGCESASSATRSDF